MLVAEKLQIDPGFYCLSGKDADHNTDYYGISRVKGKREIYYCDWHGQDVRAVYDTEEAACEAYYRILKDEEDRLAGRTRRISGHRNKQLCRHSI